MPDDKPTIDGIITTYVDLAKKSVDEYATLAKNAGKRLSGEEPAPATSWADDAAAFWGRAARDQAMLVKLLGDLLQATTTTTGTEPTPP